jgi:hypothetical protein
MRDLVQNATTIVATSLSLLAAGCSLMLDPQRLDDVPRCDFDVDCPEAPDPRFEFICTTTDEESSAPKICSPRPSVSCAPDDYDYHSEFRVRHREAGEVQDRYVNRCNDLGGVQGCPPKDGQCEPGLSVHARTGRCDDSDDATPVALAPEEDLVRQQDVLDQFCRSMYCSDEFVCDKADYVCVRCEFGTSLGRGGCGDLYIDGERSSIYLSDAQMQDACEGEDMTVENARLGPIPIEDDGDTDSTGTGTGG